MSFLKKISIKKNGYLNCDILHTIKCNKKEIDNI